jgi:hypothetical protein
MKDAKLHRPMTIHEMQAEIDRKENERRQANRPQRPTNIEKIVSYMEFGGPIRQIIVMEGIRRYVTDILANKEQIRKERQSFLNPDALIEAAENWKDLNPEQF